MVMKAHSKIIFRLFKKHLARFFTLIALFIVSIGFMFGVMEIQNKLNIALNENYQVQNVPDLYIKSKRPTGFSYDELSYFEKTYQNHIRKLFSYETKIDDDVIRIYSLDMHDNDIDRIKLLSGRLPTSNNEVLVERKTNKMKGYALNEKITLNNQEYEVVGILFNPMINNKEEEVSFQYEDEYLKNVIYMQNENFFITNDLYITFENRSLFNAFSRDYEQEIDAQKEMLYNQIGKDNIEVLTLYENFGFYSLFSYGEKISLLGIIFLIFFSLVTLLVLDSTMTRLLDEERGQIACLKTLGYSSFKIIFKYLLFVGIASFLGGIFSLLVGFSLTYIVYNAFDLQYDLPRMSLEINYGMFFMIFGMILISSLLVIFITSLKLTKLKPILLLTPKAPKKGKKVILERIPIIWNHLSFKYKSTFRNVLLFKSRFIMTVITILGSSVLIFAGLGLLDCATHIENGMSLITISIALVIFSAALCALVIYNLTNINVSERTREIATLMVLGYKNHEVTGYIFREIYIMSFIGAILGLPMGVLFIDFVFYLIDFGTLQDIQWTTYVFTPLITMLFSFLSTLFLYKKIVKTDMNASLKILE